MEEGWSFVTVDHDLDDDVGPGGPGGAVVAIACLALVVLLIVFLFRDELGIGSPRAEISIPDRFETEIPQAQDLEADDVRPDNTIEPAN